MELFEQIRREYDYGVGTIKGVARKLGIHWRMVREALGDAVPRERKTNSVESLNRSLRKIIKTRCGFPNEEAALKLLFLALQQASKKWTMPIFHWREALNHFTILWPERMPALERVAQ